jgi:mRNA-degrading endonuclease RelE of RelBE toxin-antitoxin system
MNELEFSDSFEKSFSRIKDKVVQKQIWKKILELEIRVPIGKKLKGNPFWSIHVNRFRVIYKYEGNQVWIIELLERKKDYREI